MSQPLRSVISAAQTPLLDREALLRRKSSPDAVEQVGEAARETLAAFSSSMASGKSQTLLLWPCKPEGVSVLHALTALNKLENAAFDELVTLYFPWSQNTGAQQRAILVDHDKLVRSALIPLQHVYADRNNRSYSYLMGLHSLKHFGTGKSDKRTQRALERDPSIVHPSLLEIMPQIGITAEEVHGYEQQFLRRLRRHTWIGDCHEHLEAVRDHRKTPFVMFGVHADAIRIALWKQAGLDPKHGGRQPGIVLLDLTRRARNRLGGATWRQRVAKFCATLGDLYEDHAPPILALSDDVFVVQALRWDILKAYDIRRGARPDNKQPVLAKVVLTPSTDLLSTAQFHLGSTPQIVAETYGAEILGFADFGLKLRKRLLDSGDDELANAVGDALYAVQSLIGLPGAPRQLMEFTQENYERFEWQMVLARYDRLAPRGKIKSALQHGLAGTNQNALSDFLIAFDKLCAAADYNNPGCELFDKCLFQSAEQVGRTIIMFSSELLRGFADWRIEEDHALAAIRQHLGTRISIVDRREAAEILETVADGEIDRIVCIEPSPEDLLYILSRPSQPKKLIAVAHLARTESTLRRARALLDLTGVEKVRERLEALVTEFERALAGQKIELPDFDAAPPLPRIGTLDLTTIAGPGAGKPRIISTSAGFKIRAFDGSDFARYDPDALQSFRRCKASELKYGDQICIFTPDFVESAREKLQLAAKASDILFLYHRDVAEAASLLPGPDMAAKAEALKARILKIDPTLDLPGLQAIRNWIDVADLLGAARDKVKPQAPRSRKHFSAMMKALGISDEVARHYWDLGVFWTRSMRIRNGAAFHQVFMGILIDPQGTAAWLPPERRKEVSRIYETAENHVVTVLANDREDEKI